MTRSNAIDYEATRRLPKPRLITPGDTLAGPTYSELIWAPFDEHHARLGGAPGARMCRFPERLAGGRRAFYQHGTIYERADGGLAWVYGAIIDRYNQLGGPASWLGFPITDESPFDEGGRVSLFEHGAIYWWPDVGAIELNDVIVHYTGLMCFGETDDDGFFTDSDEPYVYLGVVSTAGEFSARSLIYEDVDAGESRPDVIEIYRGKPTGIVLSSALFEHDSGDPDKYKDLMQNAVRTGFGIVSTAVGVTFPVLGVLLGVAAPAIKEAADAIGEFLNGALGTADDHLGHETIPLSAKRMVVLAARTPISGFNGIGFKVETPLISAQGGSYKIYFNLVTA